MALATAPPAATVEVPTVEIVGDEEAPPPEPSVDEDPTGFGTVLERGDFDGERLQAADLLLQAPGTTVHRAPGRETLRIRGGSADHAAVFLDGIRLDPVAGGGVDLRAVPTSFLDRVVVLRGNEGARYGSGALGGVVLLETRAPEDGATVASGAVTAGSFGTVGLDASLASGDDDADGLVALSLSRTAGDWSAAYDPTPTFDGGDVREATVENNDDRRGALLARGRLKVGEVAVTGLAQGSLAERGIPGTLYQPTPDRRRHDRRFLGAVRLRGEPLPELALTGGVDFRHDELLFEEDDVVGVTAPPADLADPWQQEDRVLAVAGVEAAPFSWTFLRLDLEAGEEGLSSPYHGDRSRPILAAAASAELYAGRRITVAPAVRFDRVGDLDALSPKLGVAFRPFRFLELRSSVARTFRAPSFGELYLEQGPVKPNPDLDPERGTAVDGGAVLRFSGVVVSASAFWSRTEDLISYELFGAGASKPLNFADAEVRGGEFEAIVRPHRTLTVAAAWTRAATANRRDDPRYLDHALPYHPSDRLQARVAWKRDELAGFVEGSHQSAQFTNRENTSRLPAQTSFRAGAGVRVARAPWEVWLSGQADNLLDATLVDQLGFPQPGRAFYAVLRAGPPGATGAAGDAE